MQLQKEAMLYTGFATVHLPRTTGSSAISSKIARRSDRLACQREPAGERVWQFRWSLNPMLDDEPQYVGKNQVQETDSQRGRTKQNK
jgi:hypothetical protein